MDGIKLIADDAERVMQGQVDFQQRFNPYLSNVITSGSWV